jgi:hypothetical protein
MPGCEGNRKEEKREFDIAKFVVFQNQRRSEGNRDGADCQTVAQDG